MRRPQGDRELSILDLVHVVWRRRLLIGSILIVGVGLTTIALSILPESYVARTLLLIDPDRSRGGPAQSGLGTVALDSAMIDSQVQLLASRSLAREVVTKLRLTEDPEFRDAPPSAIGRLLELFALFGSTNEPENGPAEPVDDADPVGAVVDRLLQRLTIAREGKTYVISVAVRAADPDKAADLANAVAEHYLVAQLAQKFESSRRASDWLGERLTTARAQYEADLAALNAWRDRYIVAQGDRTGRESEQLVQLNRELVSATVERSAKEAKLVRLKELVRRREFTAGIDELGPSVLLQNLHALKAQALRREGELSAQYGDRHPRIIDVRREKAELDIRIEAEENSLIREFESLVQVARTREQTLARELDRLKQRSAEQDKAAQQLRSLEQQAEMSRKLYETYLARSDATVQSETEQRPDARIISEAIPPTAPVFPKPQLVFSVAITVSLVMALVAVYLAELSERGFRTAAEVEDELRLPSLAVLPRLKRGRDAEQPEHYVLQRPQSRLTEAVRGILATLVVERRPEGGQVVLLTSCLPNEGKTTLALCLGRLAAAEGLRTLLIDADLRHPRVHELFGPKLHAGLAEVLRAETTLEAALRRDESTGLWVLPGSKRSAQPTRLLGEAGIGRLVELLRRRFDLVLIDTAPLLAVSDARLLALQADKVLLVLRWLATPRSLVAHCLAGLAPARAKLAGVVLNHVDLKRQARYGIGETAWAQARIKSYYAD